MGGGTGRAHRVDVARQPGRQPAARRGRAHRSRAPRRTDPRGRRQRRARTAAFGYPSRSGSVVAVAAHDRKGIPSRFGSRDRAIDPLAPGQEIWSIWKDRGYARLSGTSMATPFTTGIAALVLAKHPGLGFHRTPIANCDDMRELLLRMAAHPGDHDMAGA